MTNDPLADLGIQTRFVITPSLVEGMSIIDSVVGLNSIAAIEGPAGSGKTTTVRYFMQTTDRPCVIVTLAGRPNPLDLLRFIYQALHGTAPSPRANRFRLQNELLHHLKAWGGVLIADELQNSLVTSMQDLVWLYEESRHAFALVVVGTDVIEAISAYPQLRSRVMGSVSYQRLTGNDLLTTVKDLDHRLKASPNGVLLNHDLDACKGILRNWVNTVAWLNIFDHPQDQGVTSDVFANVARKLKWN